MGTSQPGQFGRSKSSSSVKTPRLPRPDPARYLGLVSTMMRSPIIVTTNDVHPNERYNRITTGNPEVFNSVGVITKQREDDKRCGVADHETKYDIGGGFNETSETGLHLICPKRFE